MQNYTITSAGLAAVFLAGSGGPKIEITTFKLGSGFGYTPSVADTDLHGTILHVGVPSGYSVIAHDTCEYVLRVNGSVGPFEFGEIGLYLESGELFALQALALPQRKIPFPDKDWNEVLLRARLQLTNLPALIQWVVQDVTVGVILELPSVDFLVAPINATSNAYIVHSTDEEGNDIWVKRKNDAEWVFSTHSHRPVQASPLTSFTTTSVTSPDIGTAAIASPFPFGRYLIQFTSGPLEGTTRMLSSVSGNTATWVTPLPGIPNIGDTFNIYQSNVSFSGGANDDDALFHALTVRNSD